MGYRKIKNKQCSKKENAKCSLTYIYQIRNVFLTPLAYLVLGFPLKTDGIKATIVTLRRDANQQPAIVTQNQYYRWTSSKILVFHFLIFFYRFNCITSQGK